MDGFEVRWLRRALDDLARIAAYIERDNPEAAQALIESISEKTDRLATFPFLGRPSPKDDVRELVVHEHYLVSYRLRKGRAPWAIEILQVWHTARDRK